MSQVLIGWYLAWEATGAVADGKREKKQVSLRPWVWDSGYEVAVRWEW